MEKAEQIGQRPNKGRDTAYIPRNRHDKPEADANRITPKECTPALERWGYKQQESHNISSSKKY